MLKTRDVTLNEQQVSLVLGMIWEMRRERLFDESDLELVNYTEKLFEDIENEMYNEKE